MRMPYHPLPLRQRVAQALPFYAAGLCIVVMLLAAIIL